MWKEYSLLALPSGEVSWERAWGDRPCSPSLGSSCLQVTAALLPPAICPTHTWGRWAVSHGGPSVQAAAVPRPGPVCLRVMLGPLAGGVLSCFLAVGSPLLTYRPQAPEGGQPGSLLLLTCSPRPCHRRVWGAGGPGWPAWGPLCSPAAPELWVLEEIKTPQR